VLLLRMAISPSSNGRERTDVQSLFIVNTKTITVNTKTMTVKTNTLEYDSDSECD